MENPRNQISELQFGKFPDAVEFQCWKVNFKTEVCANSLHPTLTMSWIKRQMTSQSFEGRQFTDFVMLDAKIASALEKKISNPHFCRRVSVEEQRALKGRCREEKEIERVRSSEKIV